MKKTILMATISMVVTTPAMALDTVQGQNCFKYNLTTLNGERTYYQGTSSRDGFLVQQGKGTDSIIADQAGATGAENVGVVAGVGYEF
ncbi:hypothetical protein L1D22_00290 [Vibrio sp. Isolate34]|uniref:hypothetical protein n=1 Tax=Vibrio sp. Isolate34 TaxID=2908540 RepID=UPI001EFDF47A|nr:hypothetical protein [Vibrio sp. Isolate34]MCG9638392.1 hypothetical protein [Vibrio sp. Isolate34]